MKVVMCLPRRRRVDASQLGAEILNQGRNPKKKENDNEEPNETRSPHHSDRHVGHLHHVQTPPLIRARNSTPRKRGERAFVLLATTMPLTAVRRPVAAVPAKHVVTGSLLGRQQ